MRPYSVNGKTYYPQTVKVGEIENGLASWYGPKFHGKRTSSGEIYDMHAMTAAHKTFPMNTIVKVTNLNNSKSVIVRINDRGPFVKGRIIDLSKQAAAKLDIISTGTAPVKVEVLGFNGDKISKDAPKEKQIFVGGNFMVQIGAFRNLNGAKFYQKSHNGEGGYKTIIKTYQKDEIPLHRVFLTGFKSEDEARDFIKFTNINGAFIVRE